MNPGDELNIDSQVPEYSDEATDTGKPLPTEKELRRALKRLRLTAPVGGSNRTVSKKFLKSKKRKANHSKKINRK